MIEKSEPKETTGSVAMVMSSADLSELLSPLGFALAAGLEGADVHLCFSGPAVKGLQRGYRPKLAGWARPFSRFAAAGMAKSGHSPPGEMLIQLRSPGAKLYVCGGSLQPFTVYVEDLMFDDLPVIEYLSFMPILVAVDGAAVRVRVGRSESRRATGARVAREAEPGREAGVCLLISHVVSPLECTVLEVVRGRVPPPSRTAARTLLLATVGQLPFKPHDPLVKARGWQRRGRSTKG